MVAVDYVCLTIFAGPARLTVTDIVADQILTGIGIHTRTIATLIPVQLALWTLPSWGTQTLVLVDLVKAGSSMLARVGCTLINIGIT